MMTRETLTNQQQKLYFAVKGIKKNKKLKVSTKKLKVSNLREKMIHLQDVIRF